MTFLKPQLPSLRYNSLKRVTWIHILHTTVTLHKRLEMQTCTGCIFFSLFILPYFFLLESTVLQHLIQSMLLWRMWLNCFGYNAWAMVLWKKNQCAAQVSLMRCLYHKWKTCNFPQNPMLPGKIKKTCYWFTMRNAFYLDYAHMQMSKKKNSTFVTMNIFIKCLRGFAWTI